MTDRVVLTRAAHEGIPSKPLTWNLEGGKVWAVCINGHIAGLNHDVDDEGLVEPSILCWTPMGDPPTECGWHVFARLEGWEARS